MCLNARNLGLRRVFRASLNSHDLKIHMGRYRLDVRKNISSSLIVLHFVQSCTHSDEIYFYFPAYFQLADSYFVYETQSIRHSALWGKVRTHLIAESDMSYAYQASNHTLLSPLWSSYLVLLHIMNKLIPIICLELYLRSVWSSDVLDK